MNVFNKYVWLVNTLRSKRGATLEELRSEWYDTDLNADHSELNARTLSRWKNDVEDIFGIIIECDPAKRYQYYIANDETLDKDRTISWMLHTMTVSNIIEEFKGEKDKIVLDSVPSGDIYLLPILRAIKRRCQLVITYHPYNKNEALPPKAVNPLCVRLSEKRWYMVVELLETPGVYHIYGLDRIVDLQQTEQKFEYPRGFSAEEYFAYDCGISVGFEKYQPCKVLLKVNTTQCPYTRSLPLHHSQKEVETHEDHSIFEYFIKPSPDFARAILPYAKNIEVLEPASLRHLIAKMADDILKVYNS